MNSRLLLPLSLAAAIAAFNPLAALAQVERSKPPTYDRAFSICRNAVPVGHQDFELANDLASADDKVLEGPKHGKLQPGPKGKLFYYPDAGFLGLDQMTLLATHTDPDNGKNVREKLIFSVHVGKMAPEYAPCKDDGAKELFQSGQEAPTPGTTGNRRKR